jgi:hypothetical protein
MVFCKLSVGCAVREIISQFCVVLLFSSRMHALHVAACTMGPDGRGGGSSVVHVDHVLLPAGVGTAEEAPAPTSG